MGKMGEELLDQKSQLVLQICSVAIRYKSCTHRHSVEPHFVDWYCLLQVEEDADVDRIRKKYLKLALQLHPDKNKHPKAEIAFKLVSQAYTCLSDNDKRRAFDLERSKSLCIECNKMQHYKSSSNLANTIAAKLKGFNLTERSKSITFSRNAKHILNNRIKEEVRVIESCLRVNAMSRAESPIFEPPNRILQDCNCQRVPKESTVFNPSDYLLDGYPHLRDQTCKKSNGLWLNYEKRRESFGSPVFELKPEHRTYRSRCL